MIKKYNGSIRKELLRSILSTIVITIVVGYAIFIKVYMDNEQKRDVSLVQTISQIIGQDVARIVYTNSVSIASDVTTQLKSFSNLDKVVLFKTDGKILFQYSKDNETHKSDNFKKNMLDKVTIKNGKLEFYSKLFYKGTFLVYGKYVFTIKTLKDIFVDSIFFLLLIFLVMLVLVYFLSQYQANKFTSPLLTLVKFLENIKDENFLLNRVKTEEENEFGILYDEINTMLQRIEESYKALKLLEHYDPLTGLMNRSLLEEALDLELQSNANRGKIYGFICFDIENFRLINEGYSFEFGNRILQEISIRIKHNYKYLKQFSKIGVDEFFLSFEFNKKEIQDINLEMEFEAQKIVQLFNQPFKIGDNSISISVRIGISSSTMTDKKDAKTITRETISAVNISKENSKKISFYNQNYQDKSLKHIDMYSELLVAIEEEQFELFYQLQNNDKEEIIGAEALMRWRKPDGEIIPPNDFIPLLENSGLILRLSNWIVETACKQLALWQKEEKTKNLTISINACSKEFNSRSFLINIENNLQKYKIPRERLKVELLESMLVDDIDLILEKMNTLKAMGVKISLDDFGTGYSSLSYLKKMPIDQIKIDQGFIKNITQSKEDRAIVKSILLLRDAFDVKVIAEGVETQEDFKLLKKTRLYSLSRLLLLKTKTDRGNRNFIIFSAKERRDRWNKLRVSAYILLPLFLCKPRYQ